MTKLFQKTVEDFVCENCAIDVNGNGFTNHCPNCLWSKHVDVNPGDRAGLCRGLMRPLRGESKGGEFIVFHRCEVCGFSRRNKLGAEDSLEVFFEL